MAGKTMQITCRGVERQRRLELAQLQALASMAGDTEEADACCNQESSTCLSDHVAVNITPPSANCAVSSRVTGAKLETFEHAGEIVRVPAVPQYQSDGDRLRVLAGSKIAWRSTQQLLEVVVYVELFEDTLNQRAGPTHPLRCGNCSANQRRARIATPPPSGAVNGTRTSSLPAGDTH